MFSLHPAWKPELQMCHQKERLILATASPLKPEKWAISAALRAGKRPSRKPEEHPCRTRGKAFASGKLPLFWIHILHAIFSFVVCYTQPSHSTLSSAFDVKALSRFVNKSAILQTMLYMKVAMNSVRCCQRCHSTSSFSVHAVTFMWRLKARCCRLITPSAGKMDGTVRERNMHTMLLKRQLSK